MDGINLSDAKARLSDLVDRAASGEEVTILRRGKAVARIVGIETPRKPLDVAALRAHTSKMKPSNISGVEILREMRDSRF
ncbi:MAG TPA: type II toxin-antitoxin system prevent-host-death family antitoxin [Allosphingosinicella sp.]|nr:type II toxin-antitoxin system prevent-host-death family antitoxin [Allosphingosinicella sp.]